MTIRRLLAVFLAGAISAALAGCGGGPSFIAQAGPDTPVVGPDSRAGMRLQAGDKLKITVYNEDKLTGEYEIDSSGALSLPLAGTVQAEGLTRPELEQLLSKKLSASRYLKNPKVTVDVANFRPFYVLGEVERPGEFPYRSGLNVMGAIAVAGGSTYRASQSYVLIQRAGEEEFQEYKLAPNVRVYPGDVVKIPERYF